MPQFQGVFSPLPSCSVLEDQFPEQAACNSSIMDELSSNKKRKTADSLPSQKRRLGKKTKIAGDLAGTCPGQVPSRSSFNSSPTPSNQPARVPSGKSAKAGPSTKPNATSQSRDPITPTRVSSRVSCPTFKKKALSVRELRSPESDGTPPISIILPAVPPSLKRKKPTSSPTKRLNGNTTPSKSKWLDPNPIELTSSDDAGRPQPPPKRVKHTHKKTFSSHVIDLCSEHEDDIVSPRRARTRDDASVVVLSTDEEMDLKSPALNRLAFRGSNTRESSALPPLRDISSSIEFQASSSHQAHNAVPEPKAPVAEDIAIDKNNMYAEEANLPRGSLQALYNEALARCAREPQSAKDIADKRSPFSSLKCIPPARTIRYATESQSPSLHTPLFFDRIILRLRARLKQPKTLDATAVLDDTNLNSMQVSKLDEGQEDTLTYSDAVMEISTVDSEAPETNFMPPIDLQNDALSDTQAACISPSISVNNMDVNKRPVSQYPSPLANQESPLSPEVTIFQKVSTNCGLPTSDRAKSSAISTNMLCNTLSNSSNSSNLDAVNYQFEIPQEAGSSFFGRENGIDQVAAIEPIVLKDAHFLVQTLRQRYDASKLSGLSLRPALKLNDTAKLSTLSESPTDYAMIINTSSTAISSSSSSTSKWLSGSSMILDHAMTRSVSLRGVSSSEDVSSTSESSGMPLTEATTLDLSLPSGPSSGDVSPGLECLSEFPGIPNLSPLVSSSTADTSSSRKSSPSTLSRQSLNSSASIESVNGYLLTPDDSPSPLTLPVKAQKQELLICSNSLPSPVDVSSFDIDMSELNLQALMGDKFDEDDDDDDISMELTYPEELHSI